MAYATEGILYDSTLHTMWLKDCHIINVLYGSFNRNSSTLGGRFKATNCIWEGIPATGYLASLNNGGGAGSQRPTSIEISGAGTQFINCAGKFLYLNMVNAQSIVDTYLNFSDCPIPAGSSMQQFTIYTPGNFNALTADKWLGTTGRVMSGSVNPPNSPLVNGFLKDTYLQIGGDTWKCDSPSYTGHNGTWTKQ